MSSPTVKSEHSEGAMSKQQTVNRKEKAMMKREGFLVLLVVAALPLLPLLWLAMVLEGARQNYAQR